MTLRDAFFLAVSGLRGSLIRTVLTILGLAVGVGAVLTVLTLGSEGQVRVEDEIARLGVDKVWITATDAGHPLTSHSSDQVAHATGAAACAGSHTMGLAQMGAKQAAVQIAGYDAGLAAVHAPVAEEGRLLMAQDHQAHRCVCLVDEALSELLGGEVLGRRLQVGGRLMRIVGVVSGMPMQTMTAGGGLVILPLTTYADTYGGDVAELALSVPRGSSAALLADKALSALGKSEGYNAATLENEIDAAREVVRIFVMVLACVAAVCMLTGGIGVMNVLLVSVRERRREIGLIKAVGGTAGQVGLLFLLEAAAYALFGGLLGVLVGAALISLCGGWIGLTARLSLVTALPVLLGAALLGMAFGVVPAIRAASMQPVDALRCE